LSQVINKPLRNLLFFSSSIFGGQKVAQLQGVMSLKARNWGICGEKLGDQLREIGGSITRNWGNIRVD
jgi:hypothetical protein